MRVLIASSSSLAIPLFNQLERSETHEILGLLTNPDKPTGRGQKIEANELAAWAAEQGLKTYKPSNSSEIKLIISNVKPDLVLTIAYGQLIRKEALSIPLYGWINIHFSELPKWRGAAPVQHAIMQGQNQTGVSIFKLDEGMDSGPIYIKKQIQINPHETTGNLLKRMSILGAEMCLEVLEMIKDGKQPTPQQSSLATLAPKLGKNHGKIKWDTSSVQIYNQYRALCENPGVWCHFGNERLRIIQMRISDVEHQLRPGEVLIQDENLFVGTKDRAIELLKITPAGRNTMTAAEFVRGLATKDGWNLG